MNRKRNLETLNKAYRVRFFKENFDTVAFIILMAIIVIAAICLFFLNFSFGDNIFDISHSFSFNTLTI